MRYQRRGRRRSIVLGACVVGAMAALAALGGCGQGPGAGEPAPATDGAASASAPGLPSLGVDLHLDDVPAGQRRAEVARLAAMGASWVRVGAPWYALQPNRDALDEQRVDDLERTVAEAAEVGMRVLVVGDQAPDWAGGGDATASQPAAYGAFMGALAERLRGRGPDHTSPAYEIMNEPDGAIKGSEGLLGKKTWATPTDYARSACEAFHSIKSRDSAATVVAGSLDVTDWQDWLRSAFRSGLGKCFDVLSAHTYSGLSVLDDIRELAAREGVPDATVWVTEIGESTCGDAILGCVSEAEQADRLVSSLRELGHNYRWVPVAVVYEARDEPDADGDASQRSYGLFRASAGEASPAPKPAVAALRDLYRRG